MSDKYKKVGIRELERLVRHHNHLYFVEKKPEISDYEFDGLVEELKRRNPDSKILHEIGSDLEAGSQKVRHEKEMLSLDKAYDEKTMQNWAAKFKGEIVASPKIDGCAMSIKYDDKGRLCQAATRGNGIEGELVTKNIMQIEEIPKQINLSNVEIRGEVYMKLSVFKKYAEEFANPRNLAAGAIKQKDPKKTGEYNLSFWGYDILAAGVKTEVEKMKILEKNKFPVVELKLIYGSDIQYTFDEYFAKRNEYDFETDGVVYKVDDISQQIRLGITAHHPRFAIAYKFQGDSEETVLDNVEWSVSRTGAVTPVAIVAPVQLSGATVTRASLHNYGLFQKLNLSKGAKVLMMRRGGVIPNLERVVSNGDHKFYAPKKCPSCGSILEIQEDFLYCTNKKSCLKSKVAELEHFIKVIECDGFGEKLIAQLYENQLVTEPSDFYKLTKDELMRLERMGDVLAEKLIRNINNKRELNLDIFLRSLGIKELGRHAASVLAVKYGNLETLYVATKEELAEIHTIGDIIAEHVVEGLKDKRDMINRLFDEIRVVNVKVIAGGGVLEGKKFLFTGSMIAMDRKEASKLVQEKGGEIAGSVSKDLDFLVVGDGGGAGSKLSKAEKLRDKGEKIKIISESDFLKMVA